MGTFIQLHLLTSYPPSNLNRDDLGRPKTAIMGGVQRLRVSSQSLKRAWRTSPVFEEALKGHIGTRTKNMGIEVYKSLKEKGTKEKDAKKWAQQIAEVFGKLKKANKKNNEADLEIEQLSHFSPEEREAIDQLVDKMAKSKKGPSEEDLTKLQSWEHHAVDVSLFGRMLADSPSFNREAACQVAHAITVHQTAVCDDFFTAVDDLNKGVDETGAAHLGETEFGAGLFYLYICIDRGLLKEHLGEEKLLQKTLRAFGEAVATIAPSGKQNSFASRAYASYALAEKGNKQPRSLSVAFLKPVRGDDLFSETVTSLETTRDNMDKVYGNVAKDSQCFNVQKGEGSLEELLDFIANP